MTSDGERPGRLKVLVLPSWYPTARYPIGGIFCQAQARALHVTSQADVAVLFIDRVGVVEWLRSRRGRPAFRLEDGVPVYRSAMPRVPVLWPLLYVAWTLLAARRLFRALQLEPDVVHAHVALPAGLAAAVLKRLLRLPFLITEHTSPFSMLMRNRFAAFATPYALNSADRVVAVSEALRAEMLAYPQLRRLRHGIDVVPNVVDVDAFPYREARDQLQAPYRLLFVGEMETSRKGVDYLLGAVSLLKELGIELRLELAGGGRNLREYESLARQLGVAELCRFHGAVPHDQVVRLMSQADLFVLSSLAETFGVVLAEAMSAGLPVVATRCGGPEEVVTPDVGVLVEPSSSRALAEGIMEVITRFVEFSPAHLREVARSRYGQESVAAQLLELYRQVVLG